MTATDDAIGAYHSRRYALLNRWDRTHLARVQAVLATRPDARCIDLGCGSGHLVRALADTGVDIVGVDANPHAAEVACSDRVRTMRMESLSFPDGAFDLAIAIHSLEHVESLQSALSEMARILAPGGEALIVYPAEPVKGLFAVPTSIILYGHPFAAHKVHRHRLTPRRLADECGAVGLSEVSSSFTWLRTPQYVSRFARV